MRGQWLPMLAVPIYIGIEPEITKWEEGWHDKSRLLEGLSQVVFSPPSGCKHDGCRVYSQSSPHMKKGRGSPFYFVEVTP